MKLEAAEGIGTGHSHIIRRPRLTRLLDETSARIILLVAPAGYGKTTLAREWLSDRPHVWYRGTLATADIAALALGIAHTAAGIIPGAGDQLVTRLRVSRAPGEEIQTLAELLADDLAEWPPDTWLVFDDYHFACDSALTEQFVEHLTGLAPVRWLIASRSRPSWASARRLLYGEIYEVGRNLLAMNLDEADTMLLDRAPGGPQGLISLADGWPALLGLAALTDDRDLPHEGMPDELYSYFAEELYQAVPEDIQQSLRRLSLASAVTPDVAESIVGDDASIVVEVATRLGFFLSTNREALELHPLLRSFLISKFNKEQDDPNGQLVSGLSRTLLEHEAWDEAFELIERFFQGDLLVELFEAALLRMIDQARLPTLQRWLDTATGHRCDSAIIDFAEAEVALKQGDLRQAEALGVQAARQLPSDHLFTSKALWVAGMSAHLTSREQTALEYFGEAEQVASSEVDRRQALWGRFTAANKLDQVSDATSLLDEFEESSDNTADDLLRIGTGRLMLTSLTGQALENLDSVDLIAPLASRARDPWVLSSFLNVHAALLSISGRYSDAFTSAERELQTALSYGFAFVIRHAKFQTAASLWGLRDFRGCAAAVRASEKACIDSDDTFLLMNIGVLRGRTHMATGSPIKALEIFERYRHPPSTPPMQAEYLAWWSLAHALVNRTSHALDLAHRAESLSPRIEVTALVPWTHAVLAIQNRHASKQAVREAYEFGLQSGNIDAFVTAYRACPELLRLVASDSQNHDQLRTILARARDHQLAKTIGLTVPPVPRRTGFTILTKREHEVIELVSQGLTNKEIGRTLYITEATVKKHVRNASTKLGVRSRTEAAMRVAELSG